MDDELRRRARAARAELEAQVDVDAELAGRPPASNVAPITQLPPRRRLVAVAGSIAAVAVAIVGGIVLFQGTDSIETSEPTIDATTSTPSVIPTTLPGPTTTVVPTTSSPGASTTSPAATAVAAVSYLDPPAATTLTPLGTVPVPEPTAGTYEVAVGDLGVAIATWPYDSSGGRVDVIGFDGSTRTVENLPTNGAIAYGPGDVVYSTVQGEEIQDFAVVAMPLSGDRVGEVVASEPADINQYLEYPPASFGHRSDGVTSRRYDVGDVGQVAIGYVDVDGNPTTLDGEPPTYDISRDLLTEVPRGGPRSGIVTSSEGDTWHLAVEKHPDAAETYVGPSPVAPTTDGSGVLWTHVGPDIAPEQDFGEPSQWVVAQLHPGGSATWWSLPDGWTIAAGDIWGTVAVRQTGDRLEVALVDFATDEPPTDPTTTTTTTSTASTTTVPAATAVAWQTLPWEAAGIERDCSGDESVDCTQILVDRDGSIVSYDPTTRTLTRHTTPAITAQVDERLGDVALHLLGPDDVVYLNVDAAVPDDGAADLVAMSLAPDDAGRALGRWAGITDRVGDRDLVATRDGLVVVGCCDHELLRPEPDAEIVLPWIGRDGGTTSISGPVMRTEVEGPTLTVHRDDDLPARTRTWSFTPPADWQPRGMPTVIPTFDGGFVATTYGGTTNQTITRGWVDGTISMVSLDTFEFPTLDPNGRVMIADDDRFVRFEPFADRAEFWAGRPEFGDDGSVSLPGIDTPIDDGAPWARDLFAFGNAVAGRVAVNERRTIEYEQPSDNEFVVTVTTSNFFDDSVFASRLELTLQRDDDGRFRFVSGTWGQVCQPGRGQQQFSADLCV